MTDDEKVMGYLGLAARAGKMQSGEFSTENAVKRGKARLVLIAGDASDNTKKKFQNMCDYYHVPCCIFSDKETIGHAIGKEFRASCAVTDEGLAKSAVRALHRS
jgi:ribosomal protein L7Ae-like RNA K-turn-binding protein